MSRCALKRAVLNLYQVYVKSKQRTREPCARKKTDLSVKMDLMPSLLKEDALVNGDANVRLRFIHSL